MREKLSIAKKGFDLYGGRDPRDIPAYSFREVARNLSVPKSTLRAWFVGQPNFKPILHLPADWNEFHALSFFNLIEANVVAELRRVHGVPMGGVRNARGLLGSKGSVGVTS
jgi:hypothetical protein